MRWVLGGRTVSIELRAFIFYEVTGSGLLAAAAAAAAALTLHVSRGLSGRSGSMAFDKLFECSNQSKSTFRKW